MLVGIINFIKHIHSVTTPLVYKNICYKAYVSCILSNNYTADIQSGMLLTQYIYIMEKIT